MWNMSKITSDHASTIDPLMLEDLSIEQTAYLSGGRKQNTFTPIFGLSGFTLGILEEKRRRRRRDDSPFITIF